MLQYIEQLSRGESVARGPGVPELPPPVARLIGIEFEAAERGRARFALEAGRQHHNPMGTVHGGILSDLADAAMGMAMATTLEPGESFTTLELKISFLRPVFSGRLLADAQIVHAGRTIRVAECTVADADGRVVARSSSTLMALRGEQARGR
ncbi:MAG: PaaI family thioesterase [Myxococcales bacterium]|nr:PaaI family thioesterase [Myxococcales bacterium]